MPATNRRQATDRSDPVASSLCRHLDSPFPAVGDEREPEPVVSPPWDGHPKDHPSGRRAAPAIASGPSAHRWRPGPGGRGPRRPHSSRRHDRWAAAAHRRLRDHVAGPCAGLRPHDRTDVVSAPPERAGAASGISETSAELGGALGIAILGSIGVAIYRGQLGTGLPAGIPVEEATAARDTLGSAVAVAGQRPEELNAALLQTARGPRAGDAAQLRDSGSARGGIAIAVGIAILALVMLRSQAAPS